MLEAAFEWDFRVYPSVLLLALGAYVFARGVYRRVLPAGEPAHALAFMRGFRLVTLGGTLAAAALGWWLQAPALLVAALAIMAEEMFEMSIVVSALQSEVDATSRKSSVGGPINASG
jgi:hypothetical protein